MSRAASPSQLSVRTSRPRAPPKPSRTYRPGVALDRFVRARERRCRQPGCRNRVPRAGELDHHVPWPEGPTSAANLTGFCGNHHRGKHQAPGWWHEFTADGTLELNLIAQDLSAYGRDLSGESASQRTRAGLGRAFGTQQMPSERRPQLTLRPRARDRTRLRHDARVRRLDERCGGELRSSRTAPVVATRALGLLFTIISNFFQILPAQVVRHAFNLIREGINLHGLFGGMAQQELVYDIHALGRAGEIPELPIVIDSPLAIDATNGDSILAVGGPWPLEIT